MYKCPSCLLQLCDNPYCECHEYHLYNCMGTNSTLWNTSNTKTKRCLSCEEPISVTNHVCKAEAKAVDWLDFMADLEQRDSR